MQYQIEYSDAAQLEIDQAYLWLGVHAPALASSWYGGLLAAVESLSQMPYRYVEMPIFGESVRRLPYGKFLILYLVVEPEAEGRDNGIVRVLHVVHGARNFTNP